MQYYMRGFDPPLLIASGRTTRLVDAYVQRLFQSPGEWIDVQDHAEWRVGRKATDFLMDRIRSRMLAEHGIQIERKNNDHFIRIPLEIAKRLIKFRDEQHQAQEVWKDILKI